MSGMQTENVTVAAHAAIKEVLDTRGLMCPYPFLQAKEALERVKSGEAIKVITNNKPTATVSIPLLCERIPAKYSLEQFGEDFHIVIRRK